MPRKKKNDVLKKDSNVKTKKATKVKKVAKKDNVKGTKIKDENAYRDINSGAVIFNNQSEYQQAVRRKRQNITNEKNNSEIRSLQKQVAQLSALVNDMINSNKK